MDKSGGECAASGINKFKGGESSVKKNEEGSTARSMREGGK